MKVDDGNQKPGRRISNMILSHCKGEPVAKVNLFPIILLNKSIKTNFHDFGYLGTSPRVIKKFKFSRWHIIIKLQISHAVCEIPILTLRHSV